MTSDELERELKAQVEATEQQREQALVNELVLKNNLDQAHTGIGFLNGKLAALKDTLAKLKK